MVDRYLASPAYGERMAMDWLDLARYADTYGYQNDVERDMSAYRDWVIEAFNRNLPYDQFLTWQLAGDLLPNATREQRIATAFNRLHRQTNEGGSVEEEFRTEYVVDRVNTFGTAMLGLTVECARCHDHRFDPITQRDYYALFAFFNNIDESGLYSHFTAATPSPSLLLWPAGKEEEHQRLTEKMRALETQIREMSRAARKAFDGQPKRRDRAAGVDRASGVRSRRRRQDAGQRVAARGGVAGWAGSFHRARRVAFQRRQLGRAPWRADFQAHRSVLACAAPAADRTAGPRRRRPSIPRLDRRGQPRLRADARSRPAGLRRSFTSGRATRSPSARVQPLPLAAWSQLVITYDGSSRAAGIRLYLNGAPAGDRGDPRSLCTRTSPTIRRRGTTSVSSRA